MNAIKGKYRNGQIILAEKPDWPEGTEVLVTPVALPVHPTSPMEILQLPLLALQARIELELQENPVLELGEPGVQDDGYPAQPDLGEEIEPDLVIDARSDADDFKRLEAINDAWASHFDEESRPTSNPISEAMDKKVDIIIEKNAHQEYEVRLAADWSTAVFIRRAWIEKLRDQYTDQQTREFLERKVQSARRLIDAVELRRSILLKVARAIIQLQRAFLEKGPDCIVLLTMRQLADVVGMHVTTVSRAVNDKWAQTPYGIFPLKCFFETDPHGGLEH